MHSQDVYRSVQYWSVHMQYVFTKNLVIHSFIHSFCVARPFLEQGIYCLQCRKLHPEIVGHKFPCLLAAAATAVDRASFTSSFMARCWPSFISRNIAYTKFQAKDHTTISLAHL